MTHRFLHTHVLSVKPVLIEYQCRWTFSLRRDDGPAIRLLMRYRGNDGSGYLQVKVNYLEKPQSLIS